MSISGKMLISLGFVESISGVFAAVVTGEPTSVQAGLTLGVATIVAGNLIDCSDQKTVKALLPANKPSGQ